MANASKREQGLAMFEKVMRFKPPQLANDPFFDVTVEHLFADVWSRGELSLRERRLITLTVICCLGHEPTLKLHLGAAMQGDLSDADIDELMLHLAHYAGWPVGAVGFQMAQRLRAERDAQK